LKAIKSKVVTTRTLIAPRRAAKVGMTVELRNGDPFTNFRKTNLFTAQGQIRSHSLQPHPLSQNPFEIRGRMTAEQPEAAVKIFRKSSTGYSADILNKQDKKIKLLSTSTEDSEEESEIESRAKNVAVTSDYIMNNALPLQSVRKKQSGYAHEL